MRAVVPRLKRFLSVHSAARPRLIRVGRLYAGPTAIVGVLLVTGCGAQSSDPGGGQSTETASSGQQTATAGEGLTVTGAQKITKTLHSFFGSRPWGKPFEGDEFSTLSEAEAAIDFEPVAPTKLGPPAAIIVSPPAPTVEDRFLVFVYDHPTFGILYVKQRKVDGSVALSQASIEELATMPCPEGATCPLKRSLAVLGDGRKAALLVSPDLQGANFIEFVDAERALVVEVVGPPGTFRPGSAVAVANLLIS